MPPADDVLRELKDVADAVGGVLLPPGALLALERIAEAAAIGFGAPAVSIAMVDAAGEALEYQVAFGRGAADIVGLRLPIGRGIAGYVAATGQSLSVSEVRADPRFAADVAARTGYVPDTMDCVPIEDARGEVLGVLSILDASSSTVDLALATALADVAAGSLAAIAATRNLGSVLFDALADAARRGGPLAAALRRRRRARPDDDLLELAAVLAEARELGPRTERAAVAIVDEVVTLARQGKRR